MPLNKPDWKRFAVSLPPENLKQPFQRYQWKVLPHGMKNSRLLCQKFVDVALQPVRDTDPDLFLIHYTDDILLAHEDTARLQTVLEETVAHRQNWGLKVAPEKIQVSPPSSYLGRILNSETVTYQPLKLKTDHLRAYMISGNC